MPDPNYFWIALPFPQHALPPMLTHKKKHQLQREPCSFFSCRRISSPPELLCMWHTYISHCHHVYNSETVIYVILFTWCFSFILDQSQRKRLPFSGIIPYAQAPKGLHLFLITLLSETSISNGSALRNHSELRQILFHMVKTCTWFYQGFLRIAEL